MKLKILRKFLITLIIIFPAIIDLGCKKSPTCGCGKDVVFTLNKLSATVIFNAETNQASFYPTVNNGSTYNFCNPGAMMGDLSHFKSGALLLVSGRAYYDCTYLMNNSNYGGYMLPVYMVQVTSVEEDLYGI